mmetsp:Transcript_104567/g.127727  ORF Transcript_104567/g.127727 Transcript_104567/m.127727 type:complete len:530 (-) Transcript_104567:7-1596(-)
MSTSNINETHLANFRQWAKASVPTLKKLEKDSLFLRTNTTIKLAEEVAKNEPNYFQIKTKVNISLLSSIDKIGENKFETNIKDNLSFLDYWEGLQVKKLTTLPNSFNDYKNRSINWLQGRRAQNYANYFYPKLLVYSLNYFEKVSIALFASNDELCIVFKKILMNKFISMLLGKFIKIQGKRQSALLICEKSIKIKTTAFNLLLQNFKNNQFKKINQHLQSISNTAEIKHLKICFKDSKTAINCFKLKYESDSATFKNLYKKFARNGFRIANNITKFSIIHNNNNNSNNNDIKFGIGNDLDNKSINASDVYNNMSTINNTNEYFTITKNEYYGLKNEIQKLKDIISFQSNQINTLQAQCSNTIHSNPSGYNQNVCDNTVNPLCNYNDYTYGTHRHNMLPQLSFSNSNSNSHSHNNIINGTQHNHSLSTVSTLASENNNRNQAILNNINAQYNNNQTFSYGPTTSHNRCVSGLNNNHNNIHNSSINYYTNNIDNKYTNTMDNINIPTNNDVEYELRSTFSSVCPISNQIF